MPADEIVLHIDRKGTTRSFHTDAFPFHKLGRMRIERLSHVEFNEASQVWEVWDASKSKVLFANRSRQECLNWEEKHFKHSLPRYLPPHQGRSEKDSQRKLSKPKSTVIR